MNMDKCRGENLGLDNNWIKEPPHPETEWAACTNYSERAETVKPLLDTALLNAGICAGTEGKYILYGLVKTVSEHDTVQLWESTNLNDWCILGTAGIGDIPGDDRRKLDVVRAGLQYLRDTYWLACGLRQGGTVLLRSETGQATGPYVWHGQITTDGNDASLFEDEDGRTYWVYGHGKIARLTDDLTALAELPHDIRVPRWLPKAFRKPIGAGTEQAVGTHGTFLFKNNGLYFLFGAEAFQRMAGDGIDTFVAVSESIYGPYSRRYLAIPHGGAATLFRGPSGAVHAAFTGCGSYSPVQDQPAAIPMTFAMPEFIRPVPDVLLEKGAVAALQPAGDMLIRDPHISLCPDGTYLLTGTRDLPNRSFWDGNDELHLWTSPDLKEWTHLAKVWDLHENGTWENNTRPSPCLWAPETIFAKGTYWITYSVAGGGTALLKSGSGKPEGPYMDMGRMTNTHIDSSLFEDEDGQMYYVWQDGKIAKLKPNMSGFAEEPRQLLTVDGETVGYEGAFIVKHQGKYILGAAEWNGDRRTEGTYDLMYAVSDHLYGPYSSRQVAVPHGGHGTMFRDREGRLMSTLFGNDRTAPFRTRLGIVALTAQFDGDKPVIQPI
jgi:beta-xylosidase